LASGSGGADLEPRGISPAQAEVTAAELDLEHVPHVHPPDDPQEGPGEETELHQAPAQGALTADGQQLGLGSGGEFG
jgi:hypothetical protein